jgi:hypothetical protein
MHLNFYKKYNSSYLTYGINIYIYIYVRITYVHIYIYTYMYIYIYIHIHIYINVYILSNIFKYHINLRIFIYMYTFEQLCIPDIRLLEVNSAELHICMYKKTYVCIKKHIIFIYITHRHIYLYIKQLFSSLIPEIVLLVVNSADLSISILFGTSTRKDLYV